MNKEKGLIECPYCFSINDIEYDTDDAIPHHDDTIMCEDCNREFYCVGDWKSEVNFTGYTMEEY